MPARKAFSLYAAPSAEAAPRPAASLARILLVAGTFIRLAAAGINPRYVCNKKQAMSFRKLSFCMQLHGYSMYVTSWGFLTNHGRVLLCIARDPGVRLRDIADRLGITERSAHGIVTDLTEAGYVVKHKDGRRNRYQIQAHMPLPEPASQEPAIGEVLALLTGAVLSNDGLTTDSTPRVDGWDANVNRPQPADQ